VLAADVDVDGWQVGQYVGHTAPKTKDMIKKAFGGILLVDEAYYLYNASNDKDYGQVTYSFISDLKLGITI
jgi:hypothetical protein